MTEPRFKDGDVVAIDGQLFQLREFEPPTLIVPRDGEAQRDRIANSLERATGSPNTPPERATVGAQREAEPVTEARSSEADLGPDTASNGADRAGVGGGEGATRSISGASSEAAKTDPGESRAPDGSPRHPIADRIEAFLNRAGKSVWSGLFSVSDQTVHNILHGSQPKQPTIDKLEAELDALEAAERRLDDEDPPGNEPLTLKALVVAYLKGKGIKAGDAPEHFGIRKASFLGLMNGGPPPLEDTLFSLAEKIPEVRVNIDVLLEQRHEWEREKRG